MLSLLVIFRVRLYSYVFQQKTFTKNNIDLYIVTVSSVSELRMIGRKKFKTNLPADSAAFSVWSIEDNKCTIYIVDPRKRYLPEQIGHEIMHCMYGKWHNYQE